MPYHTSPRVHLGGMLLFEFGASPTSLPQRSGLEVQRAGPSKLVETSSGSRVSSRTEYPAYCSRCASSTRCSLSDPLAVATKACPSPGRVTRRKCTPRTMSSEDDTPVLSLKRCPEFLACDGILNFVCAGASTHLRSYASR